jgi:hypothetical protein
MSTQYILTVGILSYNRPKELLRSIKSLLPLPKNVEVIICDDKSPKVDEILHEIKDLVSSNNIKFISNNINLGYDRNLFQIIELANADHVMLLGDDDYLEEGAVENVVNFISNTTDFKCGFLHFKSIENSTGLISYSRYFSSNKFFNKNTLEKEGSFLYNSILFSGLIFSKKAIENNQLDFSKYYKCIYIQVAIFVKLNLIYGSYYVFGPGIIIGGDGESGFGFNEAAKNNDTDLRDRSSIISNLSYHKRLFDVIENLVVDTNFDIKIPFYKEYSIRSIKAFYTARKYGRKYLISYWKELKKLSVPYIKLNYPIYFIIFCLPLWILKYPILIIEKSVYYYRSKFANKYSTND